MPNRSLSSVAVILRLSSLALPCSLLDQQVKQGGPGLDINKAPWQAEPKGHVYTLRTAVFAFSPAIRTAPAATEPTMVSTCRPVAAGRAGVTSLQ